MTAVSRSPNSEDLPDGVEKTMGDVTDYDSIASAFEGKDAAVSLVALSPLLEPSGGNRTHDIVHWQGTEGVVKAAEANGVSRLVQMSALGADFDGDIAHIRSKGKAEETVKSPGLDWVIFWPPVVFGDGDEFVSFMKRFKGMFALGVPPYPLPGNGEMRFQPTWVRDLVPILADAVEGDDHVDETYRIGDPEKLTFRETTEMAYDAENKLITIVPLPMGLAGVGLTVFGAVPGFLMRKDQYRSLQFDNTTDRNDVGVFGADTSSMKTLSAYLGERN